jgi:hypothetical protein
MVSVQSPRNGAASAGVAATAAGVDWAATTAGAAATGLASSPVISSVDAIATRVMTVSLLVRDAGRAVGIVRGGRWLPQAKTDSAVV